MLLYNSFISPYLVSVTIYTLTLSKFGSNLMWKSPSAHILYVLRCKSSTLLLQHLRAQGWGHGLWVCLSHPAISDHHVDYPLGNLESKLI